MKWVVGSVEVAGGVVVGGVGVDGPEVEGWRRGESAGVGSWPVDRRRRGPPAIWLTTLTPCGGQRRPPAPAPLGVRASR